MKYAFGIAVCLLMATWTLAINKTSRSKIVYKNLCKNAGEAFFCDVKSFGDFDYVAIPGRFHLSQSFAAHASLEDLNDIRSELCRERNGHTFLINCYFLEEAGTPATRSIVRESLESLRQHMSRISYPSYLDGSRVVSFMDSSLPRLRTEWEAKFGELRKSE